MTKSTSGGCDQFDTSPEAIDQELRTAFCECRHTDRLKTNYRIDDCGCCMTCMDDMVFLSRECITALYSYIS